MSGVPPMATELVLADRIAPELPAIASPQDVVAAWLSGRSPRTLRAYSFDLQDFARFIGAPTPIAAVELFMAAGPAAANRWALDYRNDMTDRRRLKSATIARRLAALRSLIKLGRQLGRINWSLDIQAPKVVPYRDTRGPGHLGWRRIESKAREATKADADGRLAKRNTALVRLMHDLLLRRGEVVAMDLKDVDLEAGENGEGEIRILGKGRTEHEVMTIGSDSARAALAEWIAARGPEAGPLFIRLDRAADRQRLERMTGDSVNRLVRRLRRRAGLQREARAHGLRHQGITRALDKTKGDVRKVRMLSRHVKVETLMLYDDRRRDGAADVSRLIGEDD
jgi:integrase/recombinase XerC